MPIPIRGPLAVPFQIFGITQSKMNPNICTICERAFRKVQKRRHISAVATILFADIRGYTRLSERMEPSRIETLYHAFLSGQLSGLLARVTFRAQPVGGLRARLIAKVSGRQLRWAALDQYQNASH